MNAILFTSLTFGGVNSVPLEILQATAYKIRKGRFCINHIVAWAFFGKKYTVIPNMFLQSVYD